MFFGVNMKRSLNYINTTYNVFEYIPPVVNSTEYELDEESKKREQIEKEWNDIKSKLDKEE